MMVSFPWLVIHFLAFCSFLEYTDSFFYPDRFTDRFIICRPGDYGCRRFIMKADPQDSEPSSQKHKRQRRPKHQQGRKNKKTDVLQGIRDCLLKKYTMSFLKCMKGIKGF
ncbi:uncharacterized protein LOC124459772 [Drosophila willistoni]|uniref:uncharacterized protein LOC124459772 n=1 Tax=Drosophila willistoni TaxID=7260 RepID=UPI001F07F37D|nr:uncharacterized protein LOC124459772 [Drosophila willistoni]